MADPFEKKLKAAIAAGWRVLVIGYAVLILQWAAYVMLANSKPQWFACLWGSVTWEQIDLVWTSAMVLYKIIWFSIALVVLWAFLWLRHWQKQS
jgi:hypothetical protein